MYYDAGSTEKICQEQSNAISILKGVRGNVAIIILGLIVIIGFTSMNIYLLTRTHGTEKSASSEIQILAHTEPEKTLRLVNRTEWIHKGIANALPKLVQPIKTVVIAHTNTPPCNTEEECDRQVQFLQAFYTESKQKPDVPFNFLIGGDGRAYEATGWEYQSDFIRGYDNHTIYLSFIGNFDKIIPSMRQLSVAKLLINEGLENNYIKDDYKLVGQCQLSGSVSSPGAVLYQVIQQWPNWTTDV
uniref:CSON009649 protein n=1 Tax=Culicoides sonorensis TaxID=179676 RepID=A0A336KR65_CULSO